MAKDVNLKRVFRIQVIFKVMRLTHMKGGLKRR